MASYDKGKASGQTHGLYAKGLGAELSITH